MAGSRPHKHELQLSLALPWYVVYYWPADGRDYLSLSRSLPANAFRTLFLFLECGWCVGSVFVEREQWIFIICRYAQSVDFFKSSATRLERTQGLLPFSPHVICSYILYKVFVVLLGFAKPCWCNAKWLFITGSSTGSISFAIGEVG